MSSCKRQPRVTCDVLGCKICALSYHKHAYINVQCRTPPPFTHVHCECVTSPPPPPPLHTRTHRDPPAVVVAHTTLSSPTLLAVSIRRRGIAVRTAMSIPCTPPSSEVHLLLWKLRRCVCVCVCVCACVCVCVCVHVCMPRPNNYLYCMSLILKNLAH